MRSALPLIAGVLVLTGCGSTVQVPAGSPGDVVGMPGSVAGGSGELGGSVLDAAEPPSSGAFPTASGASISGGVDPGSAAGPADSGAAAPDRGPRAPVPVSSASGRRGPIQVGIVVQGDAAELAGSFGASEATNGPEQRWAQALVDALNSKGGLAGRKITPVYYFIDPARAANTTTDQFAQEACSTFIEDNQVELAVTGWHYSFNPNLSDCLRRKGVAVIESASDGSHRLQTYRNAGNLYATSSTSLETAATVFAEGLGAQGYFRTGRVGVITYDSAEIRPTVEQVLVPALREAGANLDAGNVVFLSEIKTTGDVSRTTQEQQAAILKFRQSGVDHVVFFVGAAFFFLNQAEQQGYRPRYGFSSLDDPQFLTTASGSENQLKEAVGIGWAPYGDVLRSSKEPLPGEKRCMDVITPVARPANQSEAYVASSFCDGLFLADHFAAATGGDLRAPALAGALREPVDFASALTLRSRVSSLVPAGAAVYRHLAYSADCRCFAYRGDSRPLTR